jgi:hypothetical protein
VVESFFQLQHPLGDHILKAGLVTTVEKSCKINAGMGVQPEEVHRTSEHCGPLCTSISTLLRITWSVARLAMTVCTSLIIDQ